MSTERHTQTQKILWIIIFFVSLFLYIKQRDFFQLGIYKDDASYILLAKSIINSHQFGSVPGLDNSVIPDFPFGFPLIIAPLLMVFQDNYGTLKIISLIASIVNVTLLFWGWRLLVPGTSNWWGLALSGLYAFFPLTIRHTSMVMSEPIFTTFCLLTIIVVEYSIRQNRFRGAYAVLAGVLLAISFFIRTIGIALIIGVFLYMVIKYKRTAWKPIGLQVLGMALITTSIIVFTPITITDIVPKRYIQNDLVRITFNKLGNLIDAEMIPAPGPSTPVEESTFDQEHATSPWVFIIGGFKWHLEQDVRDIILPAGGGEFEQNLSERIGLAGLPRMLGLIVSIIALFGMLFFFKQHGSNLFMIFAVTYFGILMLWVWEGTRLLYPIQSQLQFAFLLGIQGILALLLRKFRDRAAVDKYTFNSLTLLVLLMMSVSIYKGYTMKNSSHNAGDLTARTEWLLENAGSEAVVLSDEPVTDFLYMHRKVIKLPGQMSSGIDFARYLQDNSVNYILVAPEIRWQTAYHPIFGETMTAILPYIDQLVAEHRLSLVHEDKANLIRVYQVNPIISQ